MVVQQLLDEVDSYCTLKLYYPIKRLTIDSLCYFWLVIHSTNISLTVAKDVAKCYRCVFDKLCLL